MFLDFKKAFDSLDLNILLSNLYFYCFRGLAYDLLTSYLTGRSQQVTINNELSNLGFLLHGVPQGSVLGPLLFFMIINDLPNSSSFFFSKLFYMQMTALYLSQSLATYQL